MIRAVCVIRDERIEERRAGREGARSDEYSFCRESYGVIVDEEDDTDIGISKQDN